MKLILTFIFGCSLLSTSQAQTSSNLDVHKAIEFVPQKIQIDHPALTLSYFPEFETNKLLSTSGWILQGLKFESAIDKFSALVPFDSRAFEPISSSHLNSSITNNYFLIDN